MSSSPPLRALVSGAGIAGPVLVYWLHKAGYEVTVVERAPRLRKEGQTVDVRNEGLEILKRMGVQDAVRQHTTEEKGVKFVDTTGAVWGTFPGGGTQTITAEVEIVRGQLSQILYEATASLATYIFDETIASIEQDDTKVSVTLSRDGKQREFDVLVIADGLSSRTRAMVFQEDVRKPFRTLNMWSAGFSCPRQPQDSDWGTWYNASNRRVLFPRPDGFGRIRCAMNFTDYTDRTRIMSSSNTPLDKQKEYWASLFKDAGWQAKRFVEDMLAADDFYVQEIAQAKNVTWSRGRVVLVGDAASCPTLLTGMGTTIAITQAYTVAAELARHNNDYRVAFISYESRLRPWVEKIQRLLPGVPWVANPPNQWGIYAFYSAVYIISLLQKTGIFSLLGIGFSPLGRSIELLPVDVFGTPR